MPGQLSAFPLDPIAEELRRQTPRAAPGDLSAFPAPVEPDRLTDGMTRAPATTPDTAARIFRLQTRTGLPHDVIARNLDQVEKDASAANFDPVAFRQTSPLLASWLEQHPLNASLAHDDLIPLSMVERTLSVAKRLAVEPWAGFYEHSDFGAWNLLEAVGDIFGNADISKWAKEQSAALTEGAAGIRGWAGDMGQVGPNEGAVYSGASSLGAMLPAIVASVASKNPMIGLTMMGIGVGAPAYSQARAAGRDVLPSLSFGSLQGLFEAGTELIPQFRLVKDLLTGSGLFKTLGRQLIPELFGEQIATLTQDYDEWAYLHPEAPFAQYVAERPSAALQTLIATAVTTGATVGLAHSLNRAISGLAGEKTLAQLAEAQDASQTATTSPEKFAELVGHMTQGGPLETSYAPTEAFIEYFQSKGLDPAKVAARLTGQADALAVAQAANIDIEMPTSAVTLAGTEHGAFFSKELRIGDPTAMNGREAAAFTVEQQAAAEPLLAGENVAQPPATPREQIRAQVETQLVEGGQVEQRTARTMASVVDAAIGTMAEAAGEDVLQTYEGYGLQVQRPDVAPKTERLDTGSDDLGTEFFQGLFDALNAASVPSNAAQRAKALGQQLIERQIEANAAVRGTPADIPDNDTARALEAVRVAAQKPKSATQQIVEAHLLAVNGKVDADKKAHALSAITRAAHQATNTPPSRPVTSEAQLAAASEWVRQQGGQPIDVQQPALPGAEGVREQEIATPQLDAPFSLTGEASTATKGTQTTLFQSAPLTSERLTEWADGVMDRFDSDLAVFDVRLDARGDIKLETIAMSKGAQGRGVGSRVMAELTDLADEHGRRIVLSLGEKGYQPIEGGPKTTSKARLERFYRRFGFVANKGKHKDFRLSIYASMYREPKTTLAQEKRGSITIDPRTRQMVINLFARANTSTPLHELGHFFLEVFGDLSEKVQARDPETLTDEQRRLVADYQGVLKYLGVSKLSPVGSPERTREHELFADSFLVYLREGKAPSLELRSAFVRFRAWLVGLGKALLGVKVEMSDELRGIFARMLASEQAIQEAEQAVGVNEPSLLTPEQVGKTPAAFALSQQARADAARVARERLDQQLQAEVTRERTAEWQSRRREIQSQVEAQVYAAPVYQALAAMRAGTQPDGTPLVAGQTPAPMRLSRTAIVAQYGQERLAGLPPFISSREGGLAPDVAAEVLPGGFQSGDSLLAAIAGAQPMRQAIQQETDRRMLLLHGSMLLDGTLHERAQAAVANEHRDEVIRAELKALWELDRSGRRALINRTGIPSEQLVQETADAHIAGLKVSALRPNLYWAAARRAATSAIDASAKGDYQGAITAKTSELLNLARYRAAMQAKADIAAFRTKAKAFFRSDKTLAPRREMGLVHAAQMVASTFLFPERQADSAAALDLIKAYDPDVHESLQEMIKEAYTQGGPRGDLTVQGFRAMQDATLAIWDLSRRSKRALINGELVERATISAALQARLTELAAPVATAGYTKASTAWDRTKMALLGARAALRRVESWADAMDGGAPDGVFRRYLWTPISEAAVRYRVAKLDTVTRYLELVKPIEKTLVRQQIAAPELVGPQGAYTFSGLAEVLGMLQHAGNDSNLTKLLIGRGWGTLNQHGVLDRTRFDSFRARLERQGILTKEHYVFLQGLWDLHDSLKPDAQRAHHEMYGYYFSEVTAHPLATSFGTFPGGYVPAMADPLMVPEANVRNEKTAVLEGGNAFMFPTTGRGFTKARVYYNVPIQIDLGLVPMQLDKVLKFIHIEPRIKDAARLVFDRPTRQALDAFDPAVGADLLVPWLQRSATQRVSSSGSGRAIRGLNSFARGLRTRVGLNIMAVNVVNTLQQLTGVFLASIKVPPRYLGPALYRYLRNPSATAQAIHDASPFMATNLNGQGLEIQGQIEDLLLNPTKYEQVRDFGTAHGYFMASAAQDIVNIVTWSGAYAEASERVGHPEAVREADAAVRQTQGTFAPEDVSRFETGMPAVRVFTMFASYFNMQANLLGTEFLKVVRDLGLRKGLGRGLYVYTMGFMLTAVLSEAIRQAVGGWDGDDDDDWMDEALAVFFGSQIRTAAAMVPGVGPVIVTAIAGFDNNPFNDRLSTSPAISALENSAHAPKELYRDLVDQQLRKRTVQDTLTLLGLLTGLPLAPLGKPLGYAADLWSGEEEPEDALALTRGLVTGRSQER